MWLSRIHIAKAGALKSLGPLLVPRSADARISVSHRLLWSLFPDSPKATESCRPFLWREEARGKFILLSHEHPRANDLLEIAESRQFKPELKAKQQLCFRLRANPVVRRDDDTETRATGKGRTTPKRHKDDVVMNEIKAIAKGARARPRNEQLGWGEDADGNPLPLKAPRDWLDRQGRQFGFEVQDAVALGYQTLRIPKGDGSRREKRPMRIGVIEFDGILRVADPEAFLARLPLGFGSAKAFGCGLMLIRRA